MIQFKEITIADKAVFQSYTLHTDRRNCDLTFANICSWRFMYKTVWAEVDGFLILRFFVDNALAYMQPLGSGNMKKVICDLMQDAHDAGHKFRMFGICADAVPQIEALFPDTFLFSSDRDYADYIYNRDDLALLKGKRYQPKRNHINKFRNTYTYEYRPLTADLIAECLKLETLWFSASDEHEHRALMAERKSLTYALQHIHELDITGGVLHVNGQIAAFTFGAPINNDTFDVCVEKADTSVNGAYTVINNEFVNHLPAQYTFINREEDLGIEGLRKAKESYQPAILLLKYTAELKEETL